MEQQKRLIPYMKQYEVWVPDRSPEVHQQVPRLLGNPGSAGFAVVPRRWT